MTINDGQILGTTKIVDHGPPAQRWNMVILGDGYRAAELNKYQNDVQNFVNVLQATAPFTRAWGLINVYRVDISSTESGADDPVACADGNLPDGAPATVAATYFDSTYCFGGRTRRVLYGNEQTAISTAQAQVPGAHQTMVIVNAPQYGGGGGAVAWFSTHPASAEIGIHEMAHSFFKLEDEYGGAINNYNGPDPPQPNVTTDTNIATTKWRKLIQPATRPLPTMSNPAKPNCNQEDTRPSPVAVGTRGLFEGGGQANCGLYRPEYNCRMRTLGQPFCAVCQTQILTELARIGGAMFWDIAGNPNTNPNSDFLGTTDAQPVVVKTNGAERMRIIPDGRVGIGTNAPDKKLSVQEATSSLRFGHEGGPAVLRVENSGAGSLAALNLGNNARNWQLRVEGTDGNKFKVFDANAIADRLAIDTAGNVGIGTTNPGSKLEVRGDLRTSGQLYFTDPNGIPYPDNWIGMAQNIEGSTKWLHIGGITEGGVRRLALYAHRTYIWGNVGIGTTNPGSKLEVRGDLRTSGQLYFTDPNGIPYPDNWIGMAQNIEGSTKWLHIGGITEGGVRRLALYADRTYFHGNVGIGTTNPQHALHVVRRGGAAGLLLESADSTGAPVIYWKSPNRQYGIGIPQGTSDLVVNDTMGGNRLTINAAGNVGIGTTPTQARLAVGANVAASAQSVENMGAGPGIRARAAQTTKTSIGVLGIAGPDPGPLEDRLGGTGVFGFSSTGDGVLGVSRTSTGYHGVTGVVTDANSPGAGVFGGGVSARAVGVYGENTGGGYAGHFSGPVRINGALTASSKSFRIDHPLDPANKYLNHSCVESPDMMNVYSGVVTTDDSGVATVQLPAYFEALNREFRYQLTVLGELARAVVAREVEGNSFVIRTDQPKVKVSWQATGVRQDPYSETYRLPVEEQKPDTERGLYLHPELYEAASAARTPKPIGSMQSMLGDRDSAFHSS